VSKTISEWDGREDALLPEWMVRSIERGSASNERGEAVADPPKIGFHLVRHPSSDMKQMVQGKLSAPQILRARKVCYSVVCAPRMVACARCAMGVGVGVTRVTFCCGRRCDAHAMDGDVGVSKLGV
jgi:hypothetical protein